jgi:hypothetical protein
MPQTAHRAAHDKDLTAALQRFNPGIAAQQGQRLRKARLLLQWQGVINQIGGGAHQHGRR